MKIGIRTHTWLLTGVVLMVCACSSSSPTETEAQIQGALQDLGLDPTGTTTVLTFDKSHGVLTASQVECDGGQLATSVSVNGNDVTVSWNERVTPSHNVRVNSAFASDSWASVSTSDDSAPVFTITAATQDTSDSDLAGDSLELTFSGPLLVASDVADAQNWSLTVNGAVLDLGDSVLAFNVASRILSIDLGSSANLHADFTMSGQNIRSVADVAMSGAAVAGNATGDITPPELQSLVQRLDIEEYGKVVDFTFNKPMDSVSSPKPGHFSLVDHPDASGVTLVNAVEQLADPSILRVTFSRPVAPTLDKIAHSGLMDYHGNAFGPNQEDFTTTGALNGFTSVTAVTEENQGGDQLVIVLDQAIDPDFATDSARWSATINAGAPIIMADQGISYDLVSRTVTIVLDSDMRNGDSVVVDALSQVDVDGDPFTLQAAPATAAGDSGAPEVVSAVQNRTVDPSGYTVDITFSEDLHLTQATIASNYSFSPVANVLSATILANGNTVRIVSDDVVMTPMDVTLTVLAAVEDLAGNPLVGDSGPHPLTSTDVLAPLALSVVGEAIEGNDNDTILVVFNDDMVMAEAQSAPNWLVESPVGTALDVASATFSYNVASRFVLLTLDTAGEHLKQGDTLEVTLSGMRDIGGNTISSSSVAGVITAEQNRPSLHKVWRADAPSDGTLTVLFTEPCDDLDNLYDSVANPFGTRFAVRDSVGDLRGYPSSATVLMDGLAVELSYGFQIDNVNDKLDVIGVSDLAGNVLFPSMSTTIDSANTAGVSQGSAPTLTAESGERNDHIDILFAQDMSPWRLTQAGQYMVATNPGGVEIDLAQAQISFTDGLRSVRIDLTGVSSANLQRATDYDVTLLVDPQSPLRTAHGVPITSLDLQTAAVTGDVVVGPTQSGSTALRDTIDLNSLIITFDEAVDKAAAEVASSYNIGSVAVSAELISPCVVRATFLTPVDEILSVVITQASAVDLAGNPAVADMTLAVTDDVTAPLLGAVAGSIGVGVGGDVVEVTFNEQLDLGTALSGANYLVTSGSALDLSAAYLTWESSSLMVSIHLPGGVEVDNTQAFSVQVSGVADASGNLMQTPATLSGPVSGDDNEGQIDSAWVNYQLDNFGTTVDVLFSEDVNTGFAGDTSNWVTSGLAGVQAVTVISPDHIRLQLSSALQPGEFVSLSAGLTDMAGNLSVQSMDEVAVNPVD